MRLLSYPLLAILALQGVFFPPRWRFDFAANEFIAGYPVQINATQSYITLCDAAAGDCATLLRTGANTLAMANGGVAGAAVPQSLEIYNFRDPQETGATGLERGVVKFQGNVFAVGTEHAGTGVARPVALRYAGVNRWFADSGALYPGSPDSYDLGALTYTVKSAYVRRSIQGGYPKALTDTAITPFVRLDIADDDYEAGVLHYTIYAEDADTDARQVRTGTIPFVCLNNSGTETCTFGTPTTATDIVQVTAGTLTAAWSSNSAVNNTVDLRVAADTSLNAAAETLTIEWRLDLQSTTVVTPQ